MKEYMLYGISGAAQAYRVVRYDVISGEEYSVMESKRRAAIMRMRYPSVECVYVCDNSYELYKDYRQAVKRNSVEGWQIFKDILRTTGNIVA